MRHLLAATLLCLAVAASWWPACGRADPPIVGARVEELPQPEGSEWAFASKIAVDGTAVGFSFVDTPAAALLQTTRWRPGQPPEGLGGMHTNYLEPLISADGSAIVAYISVPDPGSTDPVPFPATWRGGTTWEPLAGATTDSRPYGVSSNGLQVTGAQVTFTDSIAWRWSAAAGFVSLPGLPELPNSNPNAISNDGSITVGYVTDFQRVFAAAIWDAGGVRKLLDADGKPVGPTQACNHDCSVVVGSGPLYGDGPRLAWRWTAGGGVVYLGTAPGAPAGVRYVANGASEDGSVIVGNWEDPASRSQKAFVWIEGVGRDVKDLLASFNITYGADLLNSNAMSISHDGRYLLLLGFDENGVYHSTRVTFDIDRIYADRFEN